MSCFGLHLSIYFAISFISMLDAAHFSLLCFSSISFYFYYLSPLASRAHLHYPQDTTPAFYHYYTLPSHYYSNLSHTALRRLLNL
jgi:hypothetical protein